jgi:hypothetical protein
MLTCNELAKLAKVHPQVVRDLIANLHVLPTVCGGKGRGNAHLFSVPAAVGLLVGLEMWNSQRGCELGHVGSITAAFGTVTEEWLRAELEAGRVAYVDWFGRPLADGLVPYDYPDRPYVRDHFEAVCALVKGRPTEDESADDEPEKMAEARRH